LKKVGNRHSSQNVNIFLKHHDQHHTDPGNHLEKLLRIQSRIATLTKQINYYFAVKTVGKLTLLLNPQ